MRRRMTVVALSIAAVIGLSWLVLWTRAPRVSTPSPAASAAKDVYYCPMHPTFHSEKPGSCPICSMKLVKMETAPEPPPATRTSSTAASVGDQSIFVAPEKQQLIGMRYVVAEFGELSKKLRIVGKVGYDETHVTHIHSKVAGYIEEVFADSIGKPVKAGEALFTIYSPDLVATQQDFLLALKSRDILRGSSVVSATQGAENLIVAARERLRLWDVTEQDIRALETEGKVKRAVTVYSPVSGVVTERAAYHHGTFVDPSKDLFTIVDLSHVWVLGEVYETDLPFVKVGQTAVVELPYSGAGRKLSGRIDFIYPFLDPKSRTVQVRMTFSNPDLQFKPEMFVNITVAISAGRQVLVPQDAVMNTGNEQYVFIDKGNGYVQPRQVVVSTEAGEMVGIERGMKPGERVVTGANFIVDSESRLKGAFAGMGLPAMDGGAVGAALSKQAVSVEVLDPKTAKTGPNPIRLLVRDASGKPVVGAQVDVTLSMPKMGSMAAMSSRATLADSGQGIYTGQIEFLMAWTWQTSVTVRRNGAVIGTVETSITAR